MMIMTLSYIIKKNWLSCSNLHSLHQWTSSMTSPQPLRTGPLDYIATKQVAGTSRRKTPAFKVLATAGHEMSGLTREWLFSK